MSSKQSNSDHQSDTQFKAALPMSGAPLRRRPTFIEKVNAPPGGEERVFLGSFSEDNPPKGFSVDFEPDSDPKGSVVTEVTFDGTPQKYDLTMRIANQGTEAVKAEVWQL